jgi:hypothetical protein
MKKQIGGDAVTLFRKCWFKDNSRSSRRDIGIKIDLKYILEFFHTPSST